jgi:hypothetical protein
MTTPKTYPTFTDPDGVLQPFKGVTTGRHAKRVVSYWRKDASEPWKRFGNSVSVDAMDKRMRHIEKKGWKIRYSIIDMDNQLTIKQIETINKENK